MPSVVYPRAMWGPDGVAALHAEDAGAWVPAVADEAYQLGVTFFSRASSFSGGDLFFEGTPFEPWRAGDPLSVPPAGLGDLTTHPAWSVPVLPNGERLTVAGRVPYVIDSSDDPVFRFIPINLDLDPEDPRRNDFRIEPFVAPAVAMAFWIDGAIGPVVRPIISIVRFDAPLLVQGTSSTPAYISVSDYLVAYKFEGH